MHGDDREGYARNRRRIIELEARKSRIRALNDQLRITGTGGRFMITPGIQALPATTLRKLVDAMIAQTRFDEHNDPHQEHDFGAVDVDGVRAFWKIDCYDKQLDYGSPDPADPSVTARVLTLMLSGEY